MEKPFAVFLMGPTGCGKTQLSLALSKQHPCEIISVDSASVYQGLDIGTAKPSPSEQQQVKHHLIDLVDPSERYSAGRFVQAAKPLIRQIGQSGKIPLLTGGTMFYFHALEQGLDNMPEIPEELREQIEQLQDEQGLAYLYRELQQADPKMANKLHCHDAQRIKRALEICWSSQKPLSEFQAQKTEAADIQFLKFGLLPQDRSQLHRRVANRFDAMLDRGLLDEVMTLLLRGDLHCRLPALRSVGYAQCWSYLTGGYDYEEMTKRATYATRQLIKRQLTWMRRMENTQLYHTDLLGIEKITAEIKQKIAKFTTIA